MIQTIRFASAALHREVDVGIVMPDHALPIRQSMILLHGYNGDFHDLNANLPLQEYADTFGLAIFCPNLGNHYYIDKPNESYKEFISSELIELFTTHSLRSSISPKPILAGVSMGGYGALLIGSHHPESFSSIISVSGAFIAQDVMNGNPQVVGSSKVTQDYFQSTFPVAEYWKSILEDTAPEIPEEDWNPIAAMTLLEKVPNPPMIYLSCGEQDPILYERNMEAEDKMTKRGIPHEWYPIKDYTHVFPCFDIGFRWALSKIIP